MDEKMDEKAERERKRKQLYDELAPEVLYHLKALIDDVFSLVELDPTVVSPITVLEESYSEHVEKHMEKVRERVFREMGVPDKSGQTEEEEED